MVLLYSDYVYFSVGGMLPTWGGPPSLKYEFTTLSFPVAKYMYKLVFMLSETFKRPLHEAMCLFPAAVDVA